MKRVLNMPAWPFVLFMLVFIVAVIALNNSEGAGADSSREQSWVKRQLERDDIYYEITNDNNDHGNYIETYHIPNGRGGKVYCVVYSDQIGDAGGAGISCDWSKGR